MKRINSPSGIEQVAFVPLERVSFWRIRRGVATIGLTPPFTFEELPYAGEGELALDERPATLTFNAPTPDSCNTAYLDGLVGRDLIVRVRCRSGVYYLGSDRFPCRLSYRHRNGGEVGEFAGYRLTATSHDLSLAYEAGGGAQAPAPDPDDGYDSTPAALYSSATGSMQLLASARVNLAYREEQNRIEAAVAEAAPWQLRLFSNRDLYGGSFMRVGRFALGLANRLGTPARIRVVVTTRGVDYEREVDFAQGYRLEFDTRTMAGWTLPEGATPGPVGPLEQVAWLSYRSSEAGTPGKPVIAVSDATLDYLGR